ncbi:flagellar biosynthetic protein FliR [Paenibacillus sp. N1-5-1-14]|uniref:flagellar biosynthetic protein FliR n=1 Tax=Paenibacillus radicibacter TaxID=2972488 RepID=UPI002158E4D2|nr:flagellar biosynthetic protein FliR [Paenibacillus radicibacter]MCR8642177.1 flagellar biosynthetic protein FliR [Paenibacillus radicibacter]
MEIVQQLLPTFLLILCRISAFFVVTPIFSSRNVPMQFKIGLAVMVSYIVFAAIGTQTPVPLDFQFVFAIIREILVGLLLGFVAYMFFTVVQIAGSFMDLQIGFGMSNIIDPMTGVSAPLIGNYKFMLAVMLFFAFNAHHTLLQAIMDSYEWVPLMNDTFAKMYDGQISTFLVQTFAKVFELAFQIAAPVVAVLFLTDVGLGLLTRVAPQFNIFVIGIPLKIIVGVALVVILMPEMLTIFQDVFVNMFRTMENLMNVIGGNTK